MSAFLGPGSSSFAAFSLAGLFVQPDRLLSFLILLPSPHAHHFLGVQFRFLLQLKLFNTARLLATDGLFLIDRRLHSQSETRNAWQGDFSSISSSSLSLLSTWISSPEPLFELLTAETTQQELLVREKPARHVRLPSRHAPFQSCHELRFDPRHRQSQTLEKQP